MPDINFVVNVLGGRTSLQNLEREIRKQLSIKQGEVPRKQLGAMTPFIALLEQVEKTSKRDLLPTQRIAVQEAVKTIRQITFGKPITPKLAAELSRTVKNLVETGILTTTKRGALSTNILHKDLGQAFLLSLKEIKPRLTKEIEGLVKAEADAALNALQQNMVNVAKGVAKEKRKIRLAEIKEEEQDRKNKAKQEAELIASQNKLREKAIRDENKRIEAQAKKRETRLTKLRRTAINLGIITPTPEEEIGLAPGANILAATEKEEPSLLSNIRKKAGERRRIRQIQMERMQRFLSTGPIQSVAQGVLLGHSAAQGDILSLGMGLIFLGFASSFVMAGLAAAATVGVTVFKKYAERLKEQRDLTKIVTSNIRDQTKATEALAAATEFTNKKFADRAVLLAGARRFSLAGLPITPEDQKMMAFLRSRDVPQERAQEAVLAARVGKAPTELVTEAFGPRIIPLEIQKGLEVAKKFEPIGRPVPKEITDAIIDAMIKELVGGRARFESEVRKQLRKEKLDEIFGTFVIGGILRFIAENINVKGIKASTLFEVLADILVIREIAPKSEKPRISLKLPTLEELKSFVFRKQSGDIVSEPTLALIGEAGPELVLPLGNKPQDKANRKRLLSKLGIPAFQGGAIFEGGFRNFLENTGQFTPVTSRLVSPFRPQRFIPTPFTPAPIIDWKGFYQTLQDLWKNRKFPDIPLILGFIVDLAKDAKDNIITQVKRLLGIEQVQVDPNGNVTGVKTSPLGIISAIVKLLPNLAPDFSKLGKIKDSIISDIKKFLGIREDFQVEGGEVKKISTSPFGIIEAAVNLIPGIKPLLSDAGKIKDSILSEVKKFLGIEKTFSIEGGEVKEIPASPLGIINAAINLVPGIKPVLDELGALKDKILKTIKDALGIKEEFKVEGGEVTQQTTSPFGVIETIVNLATNVVPTFVSNLSKLKDNILNKIKNFLGIGEATFDTATGEVTSSPFGIIEAAISLAAKIIPSIPSKENIISELKEKIGNIEAIVQLNITDFLVNVGISIESLKKSVLDKILNLAKAKNLEEIFTYATNAVVNVAGQTPTVIFQLKEFVIENALKADVIKQSALSSILAKFGIADLSALFTYFTSAKFTINQGTVSSLLDKDKLRSDFEQAYKDKYGVSIEDTFTWNITGKFNVDAVMPTPASIKEKVDKDADAHKETGKAIGGYIGEGLTSKLDEVAEDTFGKKTEGDKKESGSFAEKIEKAYPNSEESFKGSGHGMADMLGLGFKAGLDAIATSTMGEKKESKVISGSFADKVKEQAPLSKDSLSTTGTTLTDFVGEGMKNKAEAVANSFAQELAKKTNEQMVIGSPSFIAVGINSAIDVWNGFVQTMRQKFTGVGQLPKFLEDVMKKVNIPDIPSITQQKIGLALGLGPGIGMGIQPPPESPKKDDLNISEKVSLADVFARQRTITDQEAANLLFAQDIIREDLNIGASARADIARQVVQSVLNISGISVSGSVPGQAGTLHEHSAAFDIGTDMNTPISLPKGTQIFEIGDLGNRSYGKYVLAKIPGLPGRWLFGHLNQINVNTGILTETVPNALLTGNTGISTGPHLHLERFAKGGIVTSPTIAMIGEAGPEAVVPLRQIGNGQANFFIDMRNSVITSERDIDVLLNKLMARMKMHTGSYKSGITTGALI